LAIGLSVSLLAGFWDTAVGQRTEFIRTPKQGATGVIAGSARKWMTSALSITIAELVLGLIGLPGLALALSRGYLESVMPLLTLSFGYLISGAVSLREGFRLSRTR
jgi:hypothetical protein